MNKVMISRIVNNILVKRVLILALALFAVVNVWAQVPERPTPQRMVNDFANVFSPAEAKALEDSLVAFDKRTSNQIAIVTLPDFGGQDKAALATEIGEKWGVGGKENNNGIVILIKPKNETKGEIFISTGYGLEGALPDAATKRIIENSIIPRFKENDYYGGIRDGLDVIMPIAAGEYSFEKYQEDKDKEDFIIGMFAIGFVILIFIVIIVLSRNSGGHGATTIGSAGGFFIGGLGGSGHSSGGSSGFGGGGFGGFGGGSFGGGGAGGSW